MIMTGGVYASLARATSMHKSVPPQARFSLAGTSPCDTSEAWWVPVAFFSSDNPGERRWTELTGCQSPEPVAKLR